VTWTWSAYDDGRTLGEVGSEAGRIVSDEECDGGARITLEEGGMTAPWSITCGVYGWMVHTRFFATREQADGDVPPMKAAIETMLAAAARIAGPEDAAGYRRVAALCETFVERFPT